MSEKIVVPGEFLSTEEEFVEGKNAFNNDDGMIASEVIGVSKFDNKAREVSVTANKEINKLKQGDIMYGKVYLVKDSSVIITVTDAFDLNGNEKVFANSRVALFIRNVDDAFVKNIKEMFKVGDLVKVKVDKVNKFGVDVRTNEKDLGVIKAFCSKCRNEMHLAGNMLKCIECGSTEKRKISSEYILK